MTETAGDWGASCECCGRVFESSTESGAIADAAACAENDRRGSDCWDERGTS